MFENENHLNNFLGNQTGSGVDDFSHENNLNKSLKDPKNMTQEEIHQELMDIESRLLRSISVNKEDELRKFELLKYKEDGV